MARQQKDAYGQLVSMEDASVMDDMGAQDPSPVDDGTGITREGNLLWGYLQEGRIYNIPVADEDRGLKIDRDDLVEAAFELDRRPRSLLLQLAPEGTEKDVESYDRLLERAYNGEVIIVDELKQFDPSKGRFLVWVRYDEVVYRLHPRFRYLREE